MNENNLLIIVIAYAGCMLNVICHEMAHAISCKLTATKINSIRIGSGPAIKLGFFSMCLVPVGDGVSFNKEGLENRAKKQIFLSGPLPSFGYKAIPAYQVSDQADS